MPSHYTCPSGHRWGIAGNAPSPADGNGACPFCGKPATLSDAESVPAANPDTGPFATKPPVLPSTDELPTRPPGADTSAAKALRAVPPPKPPPNLPVVPGYIIQGVLGEGGVAIVYSGLDPKFNRVLAVKVMKEKHRGNSELTARFLEEAQITGQLQNPGIPPVYDVGKLPDGRPFFTIKRVQGQTLHQLLAARKDLAPDLPRFLALFGQVCQTLAYAHAHGVIHRDLKPGNVMVGKFDEVQVMDWGFAKVLGQKETTDAGTESVALLQTVRSVGLNESSMAGSIFGTPAFMATEQARGETDRLDERCDVFGLGGILCVILTGQPPYTPAQGDVLRQAQKGQIADAVSRLEACQADAELIDLARRCLAGDKEERPRDAGVVSQAVAAYQAGVQERLRTAELERAAAEAKAIVERKRREVEAALAAEQIRAAELDRAAAQTKAIEERKRRRIVAALALAVVIVLVLVGGGAWYYQDQQQARANELARRRQDTEQAVTVALTKAQQSEDRAKKLPCTTNMEAKMSLMEWKAAAASLAEAEAVLTTGAATDDLRERVADVRQRIAAGQMQTQRKENLFRDLDDARMDRATLIEGKFDNAGAAAKYETAFARFGLQVLPGQPEVLAQRIRKEEPAVSDALIVALDHWAFCVTTPLKTDLLEIARAADQDAWRQEYRQTNGKQDGTALVRLSKKARRLELPPVSLELLALALYNNDQREEARDLLRWARGLYPSDFWIALDLGNFLYEAKTSDPVDLEEQIGCDRVAVALRPNASAAHNNLGNALVDKRYLDDAIAQFKIAIALHPKHAVAHFNLGIALEQKNQRDDAIAEFKLAIALDAKLVRAHRRLGIALYDKNQLDDAIAAFNKAIALDPKDAMTHVLLGFALDHKNQLDDAIAEFKLAIAIDPKDAQAHFFLGEALVRKNQLDDAIAELKLAIALNPKKAMAHSTLGEALVRKNQLDEANAEYKLAIALDPKNAKTHFVLGLGLGVRGQFAEAKTCLQQALDLLPANDPQRPTYLGWRDHCDALLALEEKLPDVLAGNAQPKDNRERLGFLEVCPYQQRHAAAAKLYADAFTADAKLADNLTAGHRYNAACSAALAAAGQGKDADKLTDQERADLRKQALQWLRADLAAWGKLLDNDGDKARPVVQGKMTHWKQDTDLTGVRDPKALEKLPAAERDAWHALWQDVDALLAKTREKK